MGSCPSSVTISGLLSGSPSAFCVIIFGSVNLPQSIQRERSGLVALLLGVPFELAWIFQGFLLSKMRFDWNDTVPPSWDNGGRWIQEYRETRTPRERAPTCGSRISSKPETNHWVLFNSVMVLSYCRWWRHLIPTAATSWLQPDKASSCCGGKILHLPGHWACKACTGLPYAPPNVVLICFPVFKSCPEQLLDTWGGAEEGERSPCFPLLLLYYWALNFVLICSQPTPGYFTDDQTLDFLLQKQDGVGMKKVKLWDSDQWKHLESLFVVSSRMLGTVRNRNLTYGPFLQRTQRVAENSQASAEISSIGSFSS